MKKLIYFIFGMAAFGISQFILRIPLLKLAETTTPYIFLSVAYPSLLSWLIAFSAGLFEETGRLALMKLSEKAAHQTHLKFSDAFIFGFGHGLLEALWILSYTAQYIRLYGLTADAVMSIFERLFAIVFHIAMSVLLAAAINFRQYRLYFIALAAHTVMDGIIIYFTSPIVLEAVFACIALAALASSLALFYKKENLGGKNHAEHQKFHKNL